MEHILTGILSALSGMLATGIPTYIAYKKQKDAHDEAMAKITAERDEALAKQKNEAADAAYGRMTDLYERLEKRLEAVEKNHEDCERNHEELEKKYEELEMKYEELKKESTADKVQIEGMRQELDNLKRK